MAAAAGTCVVGIGSTCQTGGTFLKGLSAAGRDTSSSSVSPIGLSLCSASLTRGRWIPTELIRPSKRGAEWSSNNGMKGSVERVVPAATARRCGSDERRRAHVIGERGFIKKGQIQLKSSLWGYTLRRHRCSRCLPPSPPSLRTDFSAAALLSINSLCRSFDTRLDSQKNRACQSATRRMLTQVQGTAGTTTIGYDSQPLINRWCGVHTWHGRRRRLLAEGMCTSVNNMHGETRSLRRMRREERGSAIVTRAITSPKRGRFLNTDGYFPSGLGGKSGGMELLELERGVCNPFKKYSPERVRERTLDSPGAVFAVLSRGVKIVWSLGMYWINLNIDFLVGRDMEMVPRRAQELRNLLVNLGPSFIKAGQVLANRPDIIREDYMNELCILQDDVPAFPSDIAFKIMEEDLGRPLKSVFSKITPSPVAAASLGQVYRGTLAETGEEVAIKVQRPGIEPIIYRDLFLFRTLASFVNGYSLKKLGCNGELIVDEFGEKLLEELDYTQEARNIDDFFRNFEGDPTVKIPKVYKGLSSTRILVMEWIDGIRCTDPQAIRNSGVDVQAFITIGVCSGLRQLLEFGLFHGDPHPGNIFAMRDGRIAYVDFGNVAELSQFNKQILIDAIVHAVNEDYVEMAGDFTRLGFLAPGTDVEPIVPALEKIWQNSLGKGLADFNFRSVTGKFNELVYEYPVRIPERFSLVIRSLLTQEGICLTLQPDFKFLEVAYPYIAKRLLTDPDPALRERLLQVLFKNGIFQWKRLENLITLAKEQVQLMESTITYRGEDSNNAPGQSTALVRSNGSSTSNKRRMGLDLNDTIKDGTRVMVFDSELRRQLLMALTQDSRLHVKEITDIYKLLADDVKPQGIIGELIRGIPQVTRDLMLTWSESVLADR